MTLLIEFQAATMNYTVLINSFVWISALVYYGVDGRKWFTGPKITLDTDELTEEQAQAIREEGLDISPANPVSGTAEEAAVGLNKKETSVVS